MTTEPLYSFDIALQNELTLDENIELAREFCWEQFVARGMIVDLAVHEGKSKNEDEPDNPHFHVLAPIRPFTEEGSWGNKQKREYVLDEDGNRIKDAKGKDIFNAVSTTGWNDPELLKCKFCSNGTPILKLAVHSFWFSGTRFLLKTVRFSFIIVM